MKDGHVQTEIARSEEPWCLDELYPRYPVVQNLLSRFSVEEIQSGGLELAPLLEFASSE
jgi:hypothetical protein